MSLYEPIYIDKEEIDWDEQERQQVKDEPPGAKYNAISDALRHAISEKTACSFFCGGSKCKYCNPMESSAWTPEQMEIEGLFSNWVTKNILATSRPVETFVKKHDLITKLHDAGIASIINLQTPGEHLHCCPELDDSGFSYSPKTFMDNDIFFYNFGWPDYGIGSMQNLVDMVRVMQFAVSEGKVAVHCHAGLGRTGVLIACYLIFTNRLSAYEAVHYVRSKRKGAIQTKGQVACIQEFAEYLQPLRVIYRIDKSQPELPLHTYLSHQDKVLHGLEAKRLRYIPKIVYVIGERLVELSSSVSPNQHKAKKFSGRSAKERNHSLKMLKKNVPKAFNNRQFEATDDEDDMAGRADLTRSLGFNEHRDGYSHSSQGYNRISGEEECVGGGSESGESIVESQPLRGMKRREDRVRVVANALAGLTEPASDVTNKVNSYKVGLNEDDYTWRDLSDEDSPVVLSELLWDWLNDLKEPIITAQDLPVLLQCEHVEDVFPKLSKAVVHTMRYLFTILARLVPLDEDTEAALYARIMEALLHNTLTFDVFPSGRSVADSIVSTTSSLASNISTGSITSTGSTSRQLTASTTAKCMVFAAQMYDYCVYEVERQQAPKLQPQPPSKQTRQRNIKGSR